MSYRMLGDDRVRNITILVRVSEVSHDSPLKCMHDIRYLKGARQLAGMLFQG